MTIAYLDANAIIRFIESDDDEICCICSIAGRSISHSRLVTSEFTLAEVLVVPLNAGQSSNLVRIYEDRL